MFSKKPNKEPKAVAAARNVSESTFSVLGSGLTITGDISASADLHIDGRVEGDIACASLVQGEGSEIVGAITAQTARLSGRVEGAIDCRDLVILKSARIQGDVQYDALTIEQGAVVDGRLSPRGSDNAARPAPTLVDDSLKLANTAV